MRLLFVLLATLLLTSCRSSGPPPASDTPRPAPIEVEIREAEGEEATQSSVEHPPVFTWTPPTALWVEVRHEATGRVVWRIEQFGNPHGTAYLYAPLVYGSYARGPGWSPPPDAAEPLATPAETLVEGERYTVTVHLTAIEGPMPPTAVAEFEGTLTFTY